LLIVFCFRWVIKVDPGRSRIEAFLVKRLPHDTVGNRRRVALPGQQAGEPPDARVQRLSPGAGQPPLDQPACGARPDRPRP